MAGRCSAAPRCTQRSIPPWSCEVSTLARSGDSIELELLQERAPREAEHLRRVTLVPCRLREGIEDVLLLDHRLDLRAQRRVGAGLLQPTGPSSPATRATCRSRRGATAPPVRAERQGRAPGARAETRRSPAHMTTARSMTFRSSRMFPGHAYTGGVPSIASAAISGAGRFSLVLRFVLQTGEPGEGSRQCATRAAGARSGWYR